MSGHDQRNVILRVEQLAKKFGSISALDEVSLSVRRGEVLGLIGPNGSGKTTLFECLGGVLPADRGAVFTDGRPLQARERARLVFYIPDGIAPWPAQTVRWVLDFAIGFFGARPDARDDIVKRTALAPFLGSAIGALSKGQRKRVLLAIGLIVPHPVLLVDEPFDGLDVRQSRDVAEVLRESARAGRTLFLSIHQLIDAERVCDRFVLLSGGRVRGEGTRDELSALAASRGAATSDLEEVFLALT